jgi:hypothetical protein
MSDTTKHDPDERTAVLTSAPTEAEVAIIIAGLANNGIHASSDETTSDFRAGAWNWIDILVAEQDLPRAKEVLERIKQEPSDIDWSKIDVGEPEDE